MFVQIFNLKSFKSVFFFFTRRHSDNKMLALLTKTYVCMSEDKSNTAQHSVECWSLTFPKAKIALSFVYVTLKPRCARKYEN